TRRVHRVRRRRLRSGGHRRIPHGAGAPDGDLPRRMARVLAADLQAPSSLPRPADDVLGPSPAADAAAASAHGCEHAQGAQACGRERRDAGGAETGRAGDGETLARQAMTARYAAHQRPAARPMSNTAAPNAQIASAPHTSVSINAVLAR